MTTRDIVDRLAGPVARPLRLALAGFGVAAIGALLAFAIDYRPGNPLAYVAFGLGAIGVAVGFVAIAWGWVALAAAAARRARSGADDAV